jgi:hypothetical protein
VVAGVEGYVLAEVGLVLADSQVAVAAACGAWGLAPAVTDTLVAGALLPLGTLTAVALAAGTAGAMASAVMGGASDVASLAAARVILLPALIASLVPPRTQGTESAASAILPVPVAAGTNPFTIGAPGATATTTGTGTTAITPADPAQVIASAAIGLTRPALDAGSVGLALAGLAGDGTAAGPGYAGGARAPLPPAALTPALSALLQPATGAPGALIALPGVGIDQVLAGPATPSRQAQASNRLVAMVGLRIAAAIAAARVASRTVFVSRNDADAVRATVDDALDAVSDQAALLGWEDVRGTLLDVRAAADRDLTVTEQPLPGLASYTPWTVQPALVVAQRLYGDDPTTLFAQSADLVARNGVIQPSFVPAQPLEVLAWTT